MKRFKYFANRNLLNSAIIKKCLFFLIILSLMVISLAFFALSTTKPYLGVVLSKGDTYWVVERVDATGSAIQAGIEVGDKPVIINGQPAESFLGKYEEQGVVFGLLIRDLTVVDDRGEEKSATINGISQSGGALTELFVWFVVCLVFWITGFYAFYKKPRNQAALLLCFCGITFGLVFSGQMAGERLIPTAFWFSVIATIIGPWLLLHFFLVLPDERAWLRTKKIIYLVYLPAVITLILLPLIGYADGQPLPGFRTARLIVYILGFIAAVGGVIFNFYRSTSPRTRQQMKIVLISCLGALVPFVILSVLPEATSGQTIIPVSHSTLFFAIIPIGLGYAVITQKLMDIDFFIRRGIIYGSISIILAGILSLAIIHVSLQKSLDVTRTIVVAIVLGAIAAVLFGPVKNGVETLVDKFFYKDRYDYRRITQSLSVSLNAARDLNEVSRLVVGTVVNTLNLAGGCLFIKTQPNLYEIGAVQGTFSDKDKEKRMYNLLDKRDNLTYFPDAASTICPELAFIIPLITGDREVGILFLSQKISRQEFSPDDIFLLQGIASVANIALHGAMLVHDVSIRDTFISVASHELRTPLTSIAGYTDLMLHRDPPSETRKQWLKKILINSHRITAMIDDLLNITRIRSGKFSIKQEKVNISDTIEEVLAVTRDSTGKHGFVTAIAPGLPDLLADKDKLGQVIGNLLSNAVKYSPNGGKIMISARYDDSMNKIIISIADQGIGISAKDQESLFTTFHRIQRPETKGIRGSGLGLYIAKEWTEAMGGEIWFESELNEGSTFYISFLVRESKKA